MSAQNPSRRFEVKKYPNRRFYDVTRSRHVTLTDLYQLVRTGNEIVVTDSATGEDITNVVLTQIILEHDPPKLDLFPSSLLHQTIQANQHMVRRFIDQYFAQAMDAFVQSRRQFDDWLRRSGFSALSPMAPFDWVKMLLPNASAFGSAQGPGSEPKLDASPAENAAAVQALSEQLASLKNELEQLQAGRKSASKVRRGSARKKKAGSPMSPAKKRRRD